MNMINSNCNRRIINICVIRLKLKTKKFKGSRKNGLEKQKN